jgi:hypothetical protein
MSRERRNVRRTKIMRLSEDELIGFAVEAGFYDLPSDAIVVGAYHDFLTGSFQFKVISDEYDELEVGYIPQDIERSL